jgi:hypothetical protein
MKKSTCGQHRVVGYAYTWSNTNRESVLTCRGCGEDASVHETLRETVERQALGMYGEEGTG